MKKIILSVFTLLFLIVFFNLPVFATNSKTQSSIIIDKPDVVRGPLIKAADQIILNGQVDGDVFLFAGQVTVNATVSGDLIVFAGKADIKGDIQDDLRVVAGQTEIGALVKGNSTLLTGQAKLSAAARLDGDFYLSSPQSALIDSQATVSGQLIESIITHQSADFSSLKFPVPAVKKFTAFFFLQSLTGLIMEILVGWLLILLLPKICQSLIKSSLKNPGLNLGWGLLTFSIVPVFSVLLIITLIGIPFGVSAFLLYSLSLYLAKLIAGLFVGSRLLNDTGFHKPYLSFALGVFIMAVLKLIIIIGWLTHFIFVLIALGSLTLTVKSALFKSSK